MTKPALLITMLLAALAAPAAASAQAHFTDDGQPIGADVTTHLTGVIGFVDGIGNSYECQVHPEFYIGTTSASLTALNLTTSDCAGTGALAHCKLSVDTLTSGATLIPTQGDDAVLENLRMTSLFETGNPGTGPTSENNCGLAGVPFELIAEELTLTPDNPDEISTFSVDGSGTLALDFGPPIAAVSFTGDLEVVDDEWGTISISDVP